MFLDGTTSGDITFQQECTANAGCMMDNSVQTVMDILQDAKQQNKTEASLFPNWIAINLNQSDQEIRNQVTQILNSTCTADIEQQQTDNMVYAKNSQTGNISFVQNGNARANCVMTNSATAKLNMQQKGDQSNTVGGFGLGGIIGLAIFLVVVVLILRAVGGRKQQGGGGGGGFGGGQGGQQGGGMQGMGGQSSGSGGGGKSGGSSGGGGGKK